MVQWVTKPTNIYEDVGSIPGLAEAQVSSCSFDSTPGLGTSICCRCGLKKKKKRKKTKKNTQKKRRANERYRNEVMRRAQKRR